MIGNNTLTSTSSSSSVSSATSRHKYIPTINPKVKKRGSSHTPSSSETSKVKKNAATIQNVNNTREALAQEGSDQQVSKLIFFFLTMTISQGHRQIPKKQAIKKPLESVTQYERIAREYVT